MHIVTQLNCVNNTTTVVEYFDTYKQALECMISSAHSMKKDTDDIVFVDDSSIRIERRRKGFLWNSKTVEFIFSIIHHKDHSENGENWA